MDRAPSPGSTTDLVPPKQGLDFLKIQGGADLELVWGEGAKSGDPFPHPAPTL